jgi:hypothetical protein
MGQKRAFAMMGPYLPALAMLGGGIALSVLLCWRLAAEARQGDMQRFESSVKRLVDTLDERTERYAMEMEKFAEIVSRKPDLNAYLWRFELDRFAPGSKLPALVEITFATNINLLTHQQMAQLATRARSRPGGVFTLPNNTNCHLASGHQYRRLCNVDPEATQLWLARPDVRYAWTGTWNGQMCSSPRRLVPSEQNKPIPSVCLFIPVFHPDHVEFQARFPHVSERDFRSYRFQGMVVATLSWQALIESSFSGEISQIGFDAFAGPKLARDIWMGDTNEAEPPTLQANFRPRFQKVVEWPFFRNKWTLAFYSKPEFDALSASYRAGAAFAVGTGLSLLTAGLLGVQIRARRRQEGITAELEKALDELCSARDEQERLRHDLHDGTIQSLYALQLGLSRSVEMASAPLPRLGHRLEDHRKTLTSIIGELRGFILRHEASCEPAANLADVLLSWIERLQASPGQQTGCRSGKFG